MTLNAVIFDFDGLIVDTETPAYTAWSAIYAEYGVKLELDIWVQCVGSSDSSFNPVTHLSNLTGKVFDAKELFQRKELRKAEICQSQPLLPGVIERLEETKRFGIPVAIASSSESSWVRGHAERLGIAGYIQAWRTKEDVRRTKPDPELYLQAAAALGVEASACLVFEDSLNGVKAAKASGAYCMAVPNPVTCNLDFSLADRKLDSLNDIRLVDFIATRALPG